MPLYNSTTHALNFFFGCATSTNTRHALQLRTSRPPKGDPDAQWSHDLYEDPDKPSLSSRLTSNAAQPRKAESRLAQRALRDATGESKGLSIKGAGSAPSGNVVEVKGLVRGTTAADVEVRFMPALLSILVNADVFLACFVLVIGHLQALWHHHLV